MHAAVADGRLRPLDVHFGDAVARWSAEAGTARTHVQLAATLASAALADQHVFVDLQSVFDRDPLGDGLAYPAAGDVEKTLAASKVVAAGAGARDRVAPLVLEAHRLYLARYFDYEARLAGMIEARARNVDAVDVPNARDRLTQFFPGGEPGEIDWQRVAVAMALTRALTIITGGPGTGKTTTVTSVLALLIEAGIDARRIRLAAPTGKAARRLAASISASKSRLLTLGGAPHVIDAIPEQAQTLHRLLGYRARDNRFVYDESNLLAADVVVVDEASMMDLRLAHALFAALPARTRVILLGDKDQLSSVAAGMVLGDLCAGLERHYEQARLSRANADRLAALTGDDFTDLIGDDVPPLADCLCWLRVSHRFDKRGGIGRLASAVNAGNAQEALAALSEGDGSVRWLRAADAARSRVGTARGSVDAVGGSDGAARGRSDAGGRADVARITELVASAFVPLLVAARGNAEPAAVLAALGRFQVLCAVREGSFGVAGINHAIERALVASGHIEAALAPAALRGESHYPGQPILINANDYRLGLFNGDVGVVVASPHGLRVAFPGETDVRLFAPARLPPHEVAFAITIHKSQGSEFDRVAVVLPRDPRPGERRLLTRELLYTALTRAREGVIVFGNRRELAAAVTTATQRASGLRQRLWGQRTATETTAVRRA